MQKGKYDYGLTDSVLPSSWLSCCWTSNPELSLLHKGWFPKKYKTKILLVYLCLEKVDSTHSLKARLRKMVQCVHTPQSHQHSCNILNLFIALVIICITLYTNVTNEVKTSLCPILDITDKSCRTNPCLQRYSAQI